VEGKEVCIVDVERASEPVFLRTDKGKQFFVRIGNTSRALDHEEMLRYIETNWTSG
jgi:predicted HTH transcriptional regulator